MKRYLKILIQIGLGDPAVKIQLDLDKEEDRVVELIKANYSLKDKKDAIKKIIKEFGKSLEVRINKRRLK